MKHVYIIGDSISIQYGPYLEKALHGVMAYARKEGEAEALLNLDNPQGANGGDSSMVLAYLHGLKQQGDLDADLLLLNCGLHDIKTDPQSGQKQISPDQYHDNLCAIIDLATQMKPTLIWVRTTPCDEAIHNTRPNMQFHRFAQDCHAYNKVADQIMTKADIPIIDLHTFTKNLGPDIYCDHVHFHDHIRQQQAAFIAGWLQHWR